MSIGLLSILDTFLPRLFGVIDKLVRDKDLAEKLKAELQRQTMDIDHAEQMAIYAQFAAEFGHARNAFDSFVDGMNRLVRPLVTYGVIGMFAFMLANPAQFREVVEAAALTPAWMWALIATVIGFWFGGRALKDWQQFVAAPREDTTTPQPPPGKPPRVPVYNQE
jgi:hypothetical protein